MIPRINLVILSQFLSALFSPLVLGLDVEIDNHCNQTLWPALTGQPGELPLPPALSYNGSFKLSVPMSWAGRIWAKSHCRGNGTNCKVGDCGRANCNGASSTNTTLVELNIKNGTVFYDISLGMRKFPVNAEVHG